ncbi:MAG: response regulator, partial [Hyphomonadaceae bacterium]|nr:response regulator [Clostridia bacterium]
MERLKVLVVDDSAVYRKIVASAVDATELAITENTASSGAIAIERMENTKYDVVLLDVFMPEMDGIEVLTEIKRRWRNVPVIMISSTGGKNAATTLKALEIGAIDFIMKPLDADYEKNMEILKNHLKVIFAQLKIKSYQTNVVVEEKRQVQPVAKKTSISGVDLILIASSTGGPVALNTVFEGLQGLKKPLLV